MEVRRARESGRGGRGGGRLRGIGRERVAVSHPRRAEERRKKTRNHTCRVAFFRSRGRIWEAVSNEKSGAKRHAAVVQRVTWSHRAKFAQAVQEKCCSLGYAREGASGAGEWRE